ncbi:MAG: PLDc N-terminal domain-containing protein, partial [Paludibacter sp.]
MHSILTISLIALYVYTTTTTISVLLLENRNPAKSLSWVLMLLFLPFVGLVLYLIFGQNMRKQKLISQKTFRASSGYVSKSINELNTDLMDNNQLNLVKLLHKNSDALTYPDNRIEILSDGKSTFEAMFNAIEKATNHIHIEFFIFGNDKISNRLRVMLIRKAKEGVRVRMIYDFWGSFFLSRLYLQSLRDAGVSIRPLFPLRIQLGR